MDSVKLFLKQYLFTALSILVIGVGAGCALIDPKVSDPSDPSKRVNREDLGVSLEIVTGDIKSGFADLDAKYAGLKQRADQLGQKFKTRYEELDQKDEARMAVFNTITKIAETVPAPYGGLVTSALGILAGGLVLDSRKKDREIQKRDSSIDQLRSSTQIV